MYQLYAQYEWLPSAVLIVTGVLVATACALLGTFLVLRRMALVSDAISHAILPGIAIGFIVARSLNPVVMMIGAGLAGLVTVWLVETLYRSRRVYEDSSIALVFSALFALGVVLIHQFPHQHIDLDCVAYGAIEHSPFDIMTIGGIDLPKAPVVLGVVTLVNLAFVLLFYKELKLCTFDPPLGQSLGFPPTRVHYLLMTAVSITTVAAFEAVGAILVVAFLIVPPAAAYLLTGRLWLMLCLATIIGVASAVSGWAVAREDVLRCSLSGAMASMSGVVFLLVWIAAPQHGLLATLFRRARLRKRFASDLLLLHLQKNGTLQEADIVSQERFHWRRGYGRGILHDLADRGLVAQQQGALSLTPAGQDAAEQLSREYHY